MEGVHKIGEIAQTLMASVGDDPLLEDGEVMEVAIIAAIRLPEDHPRAESRDDDLYRIACTNKAEYVKLGLFHEGVLICEGGDAVDDPEPPG